MLANDMQAKVGRLRGNEVLKGRTKTFGAGSGELVEKVPRPVLLRDADSEDVRGS